MQKSKPKSKKLSAEYLLEQIQGSSVFGKARKAANPNTGVAVRAEKTSVRSDEGKPRIPSADTRVINTFANPVVKYSGKQELSVGLGYNKGGLQVLMKTELKDAGKKTSQLDD